MIVVAIVGILSSIAYPSYTRHVQKSKRTEAMVALMTAAQVQEKYYSQNLKYAFNKATLGVADSDLYTITISGFQNAAQTTASSTLAHPCVSYTIKAVAKASESQAHDETCREFTITNVGLKDSKSWNGSATVDNADGVCW